jgi:hypothetical protein
MILLLPGWWESAIEVHTRKAVIPTCDLEKEGCMGLFLSDVKLKGSLPA